MTKRKSIPIALFMGNDISSHLLLNNLVPRLIADGHKPSVFLPSHRPSKKAILPELQTLAFFERVLPNQYIYPFLDQLSADANVPCFSPQQLGAKYKIKVATVNDINNPAFLHELKSEGIQAGLSIRCYQKFCKNIIDFFNYGNYSFLWNLHPGVLPYYQGVMTLFRAMLDKQTETSYSLHIVNESWDDGSLIKQNPQPLNLSAAMLTNYCELASSGVRMVSDSVNRIAEGNSLKVLTQNIAQKRYYTFPTKQEMNIFLDQGFKLVDPEYMKSLLLSNFTITGTVHQQKLGKLIDAAESLYLKGEKHFS